MKQFRSKDGSTMAELLVALVVVMVMLTVFAAAVTTSVELIQRSQSLMGADLRFQEQYYRADAEPSPVEGALTLTGDSGVSVPLPDARVQEFTDGGRTRITVGHASASITGGEHP